MNGDWRRVPLGDVLVESREKVRVEPRTSYPIAGVKIAGGGVFWREVLSGSATNYDALYRLRAGQLVYRKLTAWEGPITVVPPDFDGAYVSSEFPTFTLDQSELLPDFMSLVCELPSFHGDMKALSSGTAERRNRLAPGDLLKIEIDLPPVAEQKRIVQTIERVRKPELAFDSAAVARKRLYEAMVAEMVEGDDTPLGAIVARIEAGMSPKCLPRPPRPDELGVLSTASVRHGLFRSTEAKALPSGIAVKEVARVRAGDLLSIRASGTKRLVGALCIVPAGIDNLLMSDYHWRLTLDERVEPRYLMHATAAPDVRSQIDEAVTGSTTAGKVSRDRYLAVEVPLPTVEAQRVIADRLDTVFSGAQAYLRAAGAAHRLAACLMEELVTGTREAPALPVS